MSISEPCSPSRNATDVGGKWFAVSSCVDLTDGHDVETNAITIARMSTIARKRRTIELLLKDHEGALDKHVDSLRDLAKSTGGLLDDEIRKIVWPVLARNIMEAVANEVEEDEEELSMEEAHTHREWNQVQLDVHRTLARFPPSIDDDCRADLQVQLTPLIIRIISARKKYQYYQGFHDVFLTLLLVVGEEAAEDIGRALVKKGIFHNFLSMSLEDGVCKQLDLIYVILSRVDPSLEQVLREAQLGPIFALSWPLTWFSHSLHKYEEIVRVFDVFFSSDPLMPIYLAAVCVLYRKKEVMATEREMPILHHLLGTLPRSLPIDSLLSDALYLAKLIPPHHLQGKYLLEYNERTPSIPSIRPVVSSISRYAIQMVFVAGAVSAAAGYYLLARTL